MNNFLFSLTTEHLIKLGEKSQAIIKKITNSLKSNNIRIVKLQVKYKVEQSFYEVSHSRQLSMCTCIEEYYTYSYVLILYESNFIAWEICFFPNFSSKEQNLSENLLNAEKENQIQVMFNFGSGK